MTTGFLGIVNMKRGRRKSCVTKARLVMQFRAIYTGTTGKSSSVTEAGSAQGHLAGKTMLRRSRAITYGVRCPDTYQ